MPSSIRSLNRAQRRGLATLAAACAATLAAVAPAARADPVIIFTTVNQPTTTSSTAYTGTTGSLGYNPEGMPVTFTIEINDPNPFMGNYRYYTLASGSLGSSNSWDFGDYILQTDQAHFDGTGHPIVTGISTSPLPQPLPTTADSVVFGYLGPSGQTFLSPTDRNPSSFQGQTAYTVNLGGQNYAETIVGFFGEPAAASVTLNLSGTYLSTQDARLEGQNIIVQGSGVFQTNGILSVAGNVMVTGGTLAAQQIVVDNDNDYLSQLVNSSNALLYADGGGAVNPPVFGVAAPTSTTLTLNGANAKIMTNSVVVGDDSTNGPATLLLENGASIMTGNFFSANEANTHGLITVDNSTLTTTSYVDIGVHGQSTLTVQGGGKLIVTGAGQNLDLGFNTGSMGALVVTGAGSSVTTDGELLVGGNGTSGNGGIGTVTVMGSATVTTKDTLIVGNSGAATDAMTISDGAVVTSSAASGTASDFSGIVGTSIFGGSATVTITGASSTWDNKQSLAIGSGGAGTVTVTNGGTLQVEGSTIEIGHDQGGIGTLTFDTGSGSLSTLGGGGSGANPTLTFNSNSGAGTLYIGDQGTGHLFIQGGATITTGSNIWIGNAPTGVGDATILGGSTWNVMQGNIEVGANGAGTFTIKDGSTLNVVGGNLTLGYYKDSTGTLIVDGFGSSFKLTGGDPLVIGLAGTGILQVQNGAVVTLTAVALGNTVGGAGAIMVDGKGSAGASQVAINGALTVGAVSSGGDTSATIPVGFDGGTVVISGGGILSVSTGDIIVGRDQDATGSIQITGQGSKLLTAANSTLIVGQSGLGELDISEQATLAVDNLTIAKNASTGTNPTGTVLLIGLGNSPGSQTALTVNKALIIGDAGIGKLDVSAGALLTTFQDTKIGNQSTSNGTVNLTDKGTTWDATGTRITVGFNGTGTLDVQTGAIIKQATFITIGDSMGSGTVNVAGPGASVTANNVEVGGADDTNKATLAISAGGQVQTGTLTLDGDNATVTVDGKDQASNTASNLTVTSLEFQAGTLGDGHITISGGGVITVKGGTINLGGQGAVALAASDANSVFDASQSAINLTGSANTKLSVDSGASMTVGAATISGSTNSVNVGASLTGGATATLHITNNAGTNAAGYLLSVTNAAQLEVENATVTIDGNVQIASGATAMLDPHGEDTAQFKANEIDLNAASFTVSGKAQVNVSGSSSGLDAITLTQGGVFSVLKAATVTAPKMTVASSSQALISGDALLAIGSQITVTSAGTLDASGGGRVNIGGVLNGAADGTIAIGFGGRLKNFGNVIATTINIGLGGTAGGSGNYHGAVINGGNVAPGDPQTMTINGDYTQLPTGTLDLQIAGTGAGNADKLVVTGQATLGGYLELDFINGYAPTIGAVFDLLSFGSTTGQFGGVEVTGLASGWTFTLNPTGTTLDLTSTSNGVSSPEFVVPPGPNTLLTGILANQTVHFTGGVLEAATSSALANPVILDLAGGIFQADAGTVSTLSGIVSGPGSFTMTGPGLLALTGANTYTGGTFINGGVLAISSDASLGAADTPLSFDGGTLRTLASFRTSRAITLNEGGGTVDTNGFNSTLTGVISGPGGLTKIGAGTLTLTGNNLYTGGTAINGGVLAVSSDANLGDPSGPLSFGGGTLQTLASFASNRAITLNAGGGTIDSNGFNLTLAGVLSGPGGLTKISLGTLTLTGNNLYTGGTAINGGVLAVSSDANLGDPSGPLSFGGGTLQTLASFASSRGIVLNAGGGTIDSNGFNLTLNGTISGPGGLTKIGAGTLFLEGQNSYTGLTLVTNGRLYIDGSVGGDVDVFAPGFLGGHGVIGGGLLNAGTVSPGNSPGTLTVRGNYVQSSAGTLTIEVGGPAASQHDLLAVKGQATLAGTLQLVRLNNFKLQRGEVITFLTANGGISGGFATVTNPFTTGTFLNTEVVYGPNSVSLEMEQASFAQFAKEARLNANEQAVASALDRVAFDPREKSLIAYLDGESLNQLPKRFEQISPDQLTSIYQTTFSLATLQNTNLQRRAEDLRLGANGFSAAGFAMNGGSPGYSGSLEPTGATGAAGPTGEDGKDEKTILAPAPDNRWGAFLTGTGEFVNVDGTENARGYEITTSGFTLGLDYKVTPNFALGISAGYTGTSADLADGGRVLVNGGKGGLYGTYFAGGFYLDGVVNGGYNSYDTHREALRGTARGDTDGGEFNALLGTGYDWKSGAFTFGPIASLQYTYLGVGTFAETGSDAPLQIQRGHDDSIQTRLGFKANYQWKVGSVVVRPEVRASWLHEYGDDQYAIGSRFASGAGDVFVVNGSRIGRDGLLVGAGFSVQFDERVSAYLFYDGELGRTNYETNSVSGGFSVAF